MSRRAIQTNSRESTIEFRADEWTWRRSGRDVLRRRGVTHGALGPVRIGRLDEPEARARWRDAEPVHVRGALELPTRRRELARTTAAFDRFRRGDGLAAELWKRVPDGITFEAAGISVDLGDPREIEKVHADLRRGRRVVASDLWAKLSWVSRDERDDSLRVRFSFGAERFDDWRSDPRRARAADELAEAVFPECTLLSRNRSIARLLDRWLGRSSRLSERIVFSNAPGGGAVFHHDAEEGQLGVAFAQLTGRTAWLALSKRSLASEVKALARGALATRLKRPLRALERRDLPALDRLLNENPRLTRRLVERGALFVLRPGDVLLLPSHGPDDVAWHSVFTLGRRPGLALSFGIFPRR